MPGLNLALLSRFSPAHLLNFDFGQAARRKLVPLVMPCFYSCFWFTAWSDVGAKQSLINDCHAPWMWLFAPSYEMGCDSLLTEVYPTESLQVGFLWVGFSGAQAAEWSHWASLCNFFRFSSACCNSNSQLFGFVSWQRMTFCSATRIPMATAWGPQQSCIEKPGKSQQGSHATGHRNYFSERRKDYEVNVACDSHVPVLFVPCQISNGCFSQKMMFWNGKVLKWSNIYKTLLIFNSAEHEKIITFTSFIHASDNP